MMNSLFKHICLLVLIALTSCATKKEEEAKVNYPEVNSPKSYVSLNAKSININQYEVSPEIQTSIEGWYGEFFHLNGEEGDLTVEIDEFTVDVQEIEKGMFNSEVDVIGTARVDYEIAKDSRATINIALSSSRKLKGSFSNEDIEQAKQLVLADLLEKTAEKTVEMSNIYFIEFITNEKNDEQAIS